MVKTTWVLAQKLRRDISRNFLQFIAIIFILATCVSLFLGLTANAYEFNKRVEEVYDSNHGNLADVWITVSDYNEEDYDNIAKFNEDEDKKLIEKRLIMPAMYEGYSTYGLMSENLPTINKAYDVELSTNYEENKDYFFLYIPYEYKTRFSNSKLDDFVEISYSSSSLVSIFNGIVSSLGDTPLGIDAKNHISDAFKGEETNLKFKVSAYMSQPENIQNAQFNSAYFLLGSKYFLYKSLNKIIDTYDDSSISYTKGIFEAIRDNILENSTDLDELITSLNNQYVVKLNENITRDDYIDELNAYFQNNNRLSSIMNKDNLPSNSVVQNDIQQAKQLTYVFPVIFFVVAILVVLTTISQMILKQRMQIGTLKSLGVRKGRIVFYYMSLMSTVALIGTGLGAIIGPLTIAKVLDTKYKLLYSLPEFHYYWPIKEILIVIALIIILVSLLTSIIIHNELKLSPADSMRPKAPNYKFHETKHETKHTSMMMALRNIKIHFTKSLMVIIGIMGCTGLLICGYGIDDTIEYGKNLDMNSYYCTDVNVTYSPGTLSLKDEIENIKGVENCEEYAVISVQATDLSKENFINTQVIYFDRYDSTNFKYEKWLDDGIGISESTAEQLGVKEDDKVTFILNGEEYTLYVNKVFYTFSIKGLFIYHQTLENLVDYKTNAWVNVKNIDEVDRISSEIKDIDGVSSSMTRIERMDTINGYVSAIGSMTIVIKVFAIILAVIVLINLAILNFEERKREIATLRVLGFKRREIAASLIYEVMILTIIGATLGLFLGYPLTYIVLFVNKTPLVSFYYYVAPISYIFGFALSFVTALIVNLIITRRVNKISMSESLKSIE